MDVKIGEEAQVCRLCGQFESIYIDVFGEEGTKRLLGIKIHSKINILIDETDPLPKTICVQCLGKLEFVCDFQEECLRTQRLLRDRYHLPPLPDIEKEIELETTTHAQVSPGASTNNNNSEKNRNSAADIENVDPAIEENTNVAPNPEIQRPKRTLRTPPSTRSNDKEVDESPEIPTRRWLRSRNTAESSPKSPKLKKSKKIKLAASNNHISSSSKVNEVSIVTRLRSSHINQQKVISTLETDKNEKKCSEKSLMVEEKEKRTIQIPTTALNKVLTAVANSAGVKVSVIESKNRPNDSEDISFTLELRKKEVQTESVVTILAKVFPDQNSCLVDSEIVELLEDDCELNKLINTISKDPIKRNSKEKNSEKNSKLEELERRLSQITDGLGIGIDGKISRNPEELFRIDGEEIRVDDNVEATTVDGQSGYSCKLCKKFYERRDKCTVHVKTHLGIKQFACTLCSAKFVCKSDVMKHIRCSHTNPRPMQCPKCPKRFRSKFDLTEHDNIHKGIKPYTCNDCGQSYHHKVSLQMHIKSHLPPQNLACEYCGKVFPFRTRLLSHIGSVHLKSRRKFRCRFCYNLYSSLNVLNEHIKTRHATTYTCEICSKTFKVASKYKAHVLQHTNPKPFSCHICNNRYASKAFLNEHLLKHEGLRKHVCHMCGANFAQASHLAAHRHVHGEKTHACPECGRKFNRRDNMKVHRKRHFADSGRIVSIDKSLVGGEDNEGVGDEASEKIEKNDGLPHTICIRCVGTLEFFADFYEECQGTQHRLSRQEEVKGSIQIPNDSVEETSSDKENQLSPKPSNSQLTQTSQRSSSKKRASSPIGSSKIVKKPATKSPTLPLSPQLSRDSKNQIKSTKNVPKAIDTVLTEIPIHKLDSKVSVRAAAFQRLFENSKVQRKNQRTPSVVHKIKKPIGRKIGRKVHCKKIEKVETKKIKDIGTIDEILKNESKSETGGDIEAPSEPVNIKQEADLVENQSDKSIPLADIGSQSKLQKFVWIPRNVPDMLQSGSPSDCESSPEKIGNHKSIIRKSDEKRSNNLSGNDVHTEGKSNGTVRNSSDEFLSETSLKSSEVVDKNNSGEKNIPDKIENTSIELSEGNPKIPTEKLSGSVPKCQESKKKEVTRPRSARSSAIRKLREMDSEEKDEPQRPTKLHRKGRVVKKVSEQTSSDDEDDEDDGQEYPSKHQRNGTYGKVSELISQEDKEAIEKFYTIDMSVINESKVQESLKYIDKKKVICKICNASYPRMDKCQVHIWGHLDMKPYKCTVCEFSTVTVTNIRCHIRKSHLKIKPFECHICGKKYVTSVLLDEHFNTHTGARPFKCKLCDYASASRQVLSYHTATHKSAKDINCNVCGRLFFSKGRMRAHLITHNRDKSLMCKYCSHHFANPESLQRHYDNVHSKDYICPICGKATKSRKALHNHLNVHSAAKYKCSLCPNVYKSSHILKEHLLKHEGIRKYKCDVCEKDFAQLSHLAAHRAVHSEKRYLCPGCQRPFNRHDNMKSHTKRCEMFQADPSLQHLLARRSRSSSKTNLTENHVELTDNNVPKKNSSSESLVLSSTASVQNQDESNLNDTENIRKNMERRGETIPETKFPPENQSPMAASNNEKIVVTQSVIGIESF